MKRPTQAAIAKRLMISKMTVSRALRGEKNVSEPLRARVLRTAETMGYRPDPEVSRMMTHLRTARERRRPQTLGFVWTDHVGGVLSPWAEGLFRGAETKADAMGYRLDTFEISAGKMTAWRVAEVMETRGVRGFILSPLVSRSRGRLKMPWDRFSCVMIGMGYLRPALHRVHHHHFLGMHTSLRQLRKEGLRRIGFFADAKLDQRMFGAWSASFLCHHPLGVAAAEPLMHLPKSPTRQGFLAWIGQTRPEVVLASGIEPQKWMEALPVAERPAFATLTWTSEHPELPGLDQQTEVLGATAVELLVDQIHRNERGIPTNPKMVMTGGVWRNSAVRPLAGLIG